MDEKELGLIIKEGEGLTIEFKEKYTPRIVEDIVAFSNTRGGFILLGINDNGKVTGERLTNNMKADINSLARGCDPHVSVKSISQIGNVVVIEIPEGEDEPYSCSAGYYRRLDAVSQKMSRKELQIMFQKSISIPFEERINDEVTWKDISKTKIKAFLKEAEIHTSRIVPREVFESFKLSKDDKIKNAGILFFASDPRKFIFHTEATLVAFKGTERIHIYDKLDVRDDLLTQFNEAIMFLKKHLNVRIEIKDANRKNIYEIPIDALREAVANAIMHRDYSMRGTSLMVEVHDDRVDISNPGGLPEGLDINSLGKEEISVRRNELIADLFSRMDKAERIGTGMKRMRKMMKDAGLPYPEIKSGTFFTISFERSRYQPPEITGKETIEKTSKKTIEKTGEKIIRLIKGNSAITIQELSKETGLSVQGVMWNLNKLKKGKRIKRIGPDKGGYWKVIK